MKPRLILTLALVGFGVWPLARAQDSATTKNQKPGAISKEANAQAKDQGALVAAPPSIYGFSVKSIDGKLVNLGDEKGKVVMIVNVASRCGFTPQYTALEALYRRYKDRGFVILGFPSNNFLHQEPGSNEEIAKFCKAKYDVTFPLFEKGDVTGKDKQALYRYLTEQSPKEFTGEIKWNFTKFLIDREGKIAARFGPSTKPDSGEVVQKIEELLK